MSRYDIIIGTSILLFAFLFWEAYSHTAGTFEVHSFSISWALGTLTLYLTSLSLQLLLGRNRSLFVALFLISIVPVFIFYPFSWVTTALFVLTALVGSLAFARTKREIATRVTAQVYGPLRSGLPIILTVLSLLMDSLYYSSRSAAYSVTGEEILPRGVYNWLIQSPYGARTFNMILPDFNPKLTVDQYLIQQFDSKSQVKFSSLSKEAQRAFLEESRAQIFHDFGISVQGSETLGDVFYKAMLARSRDLVEPYQKFFPLAFAITLFFVLRTVGTPFSLIVILLAWAIVALMSRYGIVGVSKEQRVHEELKWN